MIRFIYFYGTKGQTEVQWGDVVVALQPEGRGFNSSQIRGQRKT